MKVGIMGGTFDPIHNGHLATAEAVNDALMLDQVLFIPAAVPPHKRGRHIADSFHRLAMTILATCSHPNFHVSTVELDREGPSYAVDTVDALKKIFPSDTDFYFILGADAALELHTWHNAFELVSKCFFVAATRQGTDFDLADVHKNFPVELQHHIIHVETPALEISSTDIRDKILRHQSIKYLVPEPVEQYLRKEGLYCDC